MKRITLISLSLITLFLVSCGGTKATKTSPKILKGYWSASSITYSEEGDFVVELFGDTSKECFEGSTWRFIPNNNTGIYTINGNDCPTGDRNFIFAIQEPNAGTGLYDFLLKPTNAKKKSETGNTGFRLQLTHLTENSMSWKQSLNLDGKPFSITINFTKINE